MSAETIFHPSKWLKLFEWFLFPEKPAKKGCKATLHSITLTGYTLTTKHSEKAKDSKVESIRRGLEGHTANPEWLPKEILPYTQSSVTRPDC